jgi:hypothetical protein
MRIMWRVLSIAALWMFSFSFKLLCNILDNIPIDVSLSALLSPLTHATVAISYANLVCFWIILLCGQG